MRPLFHPRLVNGRYGDPTVYVETLFEKRGLLFDLGEIAAFPPRKLQRIDQIFVSHAHTIISSDSTICFVSSWGARRPSSLWSVGPGRTRLS